MVETVMNLPILGARVRIERLEPTHAQAVVAYRSLPAVQRFQAGGLGSLEDVHALGTSQLSRLPLEAPGWFQLVILVNGDVVGDIGLHAVDEEQVEIGITLAPAFQGKGYAREALRATLDAVLAVRHRAFASVDPRNTPCIVLLEHLGLRQEAHHRESIRDGDGWADDVVYAVLAKEWT